MQWLVISYDQQMGIRPKLDASYIMPLRFRSTADIVVCCGVTTEDTGYWPEGSGREEIDNDYVSVAQVP
jgi:hypothetical protein